LIAKHLQIGGSGSRSTISGKLFLVLAPALAAFAELKISQDFVRNCALEAANARSARPSSISRIGSAALRSRRDREPVELQALMAMGCDFGQAR